MTMIPPHPNLGARHGAAPITTSSWVGRQVLLRRVAAADRRILAGFDQDPTRAPYAQTDGYRHWAAHRANHVDSPDDFQLAIETRRDQVLVGSMCISKADDPDVFSYGVGIGPMHRRHGYADDAIITLLAVMFGRRRFRHCQVGIYQENVASIALHTKLGFREEGRASEPDSLSDRTLHLVIMGLSAEDFTARHLPRNH